IVWCRDGVLTITFGELQVEPPSVVSENMAGPRNAAVCSSASGLPFGSSSRSQTTYASPAFVGLAVTDSLSLKNWKLGALSAMMTLRFCQVLPPSADVAAATALLLSDALKEIETA